jgi:hypothetical protein
MKKRAILLYLDEEDDVQVDLALYKVTFFYTDAHGDKVSIESDSDIVSAAKQFTEGGLKVFASVQTRQDKAQAPPTEAPTSRGSVAQTSTQSTTSVEGLSTQAAYSSADALVLKSTPTPGTGKVNAVWEQVQSFTNAMPTKTQAQDSDSAITEATRRCHEDVKKAEEKKEADTITKAIRRCFNYVKQAEEQLDNNAEAIRRRLEDAKKAEEKMQADTVSQTLEDVVQKEEKSPQTETCAECETTEEITCEEDEQATNSGEQESDDEGTDPCYPEASPVKSSVPMEVDIVSKGDAKPSFASDAQGSGEIAAVLGETLDRVAQAIDDMHLEFDRTPSAEEIEKEIFSECAKKVNHEGWREEKISKISQPGEDGKDDFSHDSWSVVSDDSSDAESSD